MDLTSNRLNRMVMLGALYFSQGVPYGFLFYTVAALFAAEGMSAGDIGAISAMASLPWSFKWIGAILVDIKQDSRFGSRRPWLVFAQGGFLLATSAMLLIPDPMSSLRQLSVIVLIQNSFSAFQDVATDALAIDNLPASERARANSVMTASNQIGIIFGGVCLNWVLNAIGFQAAIILQIAVMLLVLWLTILIKEKNNHFSSEHSKVQVVPSRRLPKLALTILFSSKQRLSLAIVSLMIALLGALFSVLGNILFIQDTGWDKDTYIMATGGWALASGVIGAISGGVLADRLGKRRIALCAVVINSLILFIFGTFSMAREQLEIAIPLLLLRSFTSGAFATILYSILMGFCDRRIAAIHFTLYMALMNLGGTLGAGAAGAFHAQFDWNAALWIIGFGYLSICVFLPRTSEA